jgi:hypothetical protein
MTEKCRVLILGFRKRGKEAEAGRYEELIHRFRHLADEAPADTLFRD